MTSKDIRSFAHSEKLLPVLRLFPEEKAALRHLFQNSSSFRALCEDYRDCLVALQHWQQAATQEAPEVSHSYAELRRELEEEIREYLEPERDARLKGKKIE